MRANLAQTEPALQKKWDSLELAKKVLHKNKNQNEYFICDGPAYANGKIHAGTAMNKVLKDFIVRFRSCVLHEKVEFICGWDTHGLPIELAVLKHERSLSNATEPALIREKCEAYARSQIDLQKSQFAKLGLLTDFNNYYRTNDFKYELFQLKVFQKLIQEQVLYRAYKPVHWSWSSRSALAEAEVEYKNIKSTAVYVTFSLLKSNAILCKNAKFVIWTTTPWTLPSNRLLAINDKINYVVIKVLDQELIVAEALLHDFVTTTHIEKYTLLQTLLGAELIGDITQHPFYNKQVVPVVSGHHVTIEIGTGIVHIAPGFGEDDYLIGQEHNIKPFAPINEKGVFTSEIQDPDLIGVFYEKSNIIVLNKLKNHNNLFNSYEFNHSHPMDWRTKKPLIFRATRQWFLGLNDIKSQLHKTIQKINWHPTWGQDRMVSMIENRRDWCISRQRKWGLPIIAFYDKNHKLFCNTEIIDFVLERFIKKQSCNIWYQKPANFFLPDKYQDLNLTKEIDTMDVWFDSGVTCLFMNEQYGKNLPLSSVLEGKDQFRGWFNSSLILNHFFNINTIPFQQTIVHGFVVDEQGNKLSKSKQNYIDFDKLINLFGADLFRLWVANVDFTGDLKLGLNLMDQIRKQYLKIRNTFRFLIGNIHDFDPKTTYEFNNLPKLDQFMLLKARALQIQINKAYQALNFSKVVKLLQKFLVFDLSNFYLDFSKDVLYVNHPDDIRRRQMQYVFYNLLLFLIDAYKIILVHTCEEIYSYLPGTEKQASCFLTKYFDLSKVLPKLSPQHLSILKTWNQVLLFKEILNKQQEIAKIKQKINRTYEMDIEIRVHKNNDFIHLIQQIDDLDQILLVHKISFTDVFLESDKQEERFTILISRAVGEKCARCWKISDQYDVDSNLCNICCKIVNQLSTDNN